MKKYLIFLLSFISSYSFAKILYYGSETEILTLVHDTVTILRFDEEVKTISQASNFLIEPADPNDPNYKVLSIKPRSLKGTDLVSFILANDAVVSLKIKTIGQGTPEKMDYFYDLKTKDLKVDPLSDGTKGTEVTELELMKAMIRRDNIVEYISKPLSSDIPTGVEDVNAKLVTAYSGPRFNGYIFKVTNHASDKQFTLDLKSLSLGRPNTALLSQVDEKVLAGKKSTYLRIVAKPTASYSSLVLPMTPIVSK